MFRAAPLFALLACATTTAQRAPYQIEVDGTLAARSSKQVAAPATLDAKPWKVGQWATYRRTDGPGFDYQAVVAEDGCGFWIEMLREHYDRRLTVLLCMRSPWTLSDSERPPILDLLQIAIVRVGGAVPTVIDFRRGENARQKAELAPLVKSLFLLDVVVHADNPREDVDVPAGHFAGAVHGTTSEELNAHVWFHPDVPFDGTVKTRARDGREYVLLDYGEDRVDSILTHFVHEVGAEAGPPPVFPQRRAFFALAIGLGMLTGASGEASTPGGGFGAAFGVHLGRDLDVLADVNAFYQESYSPDPTVQQSSGTLVLGVRWFPWHRTVEPLRPFDHRDVFVQGDLGAALISRRASTTSDPTTIWGFAAGASVGWFWIQRRGYGAAYVLGDRLGFYGSGEGIRHNLALTVMFEISP